MHHKYGSNAKSVVDDASEAVGNVFQAATFVSLMEITALTKAVARNTGRNSTTSNSVQS